MKIEIPDEAVEHIVRQDLSLMLAGLRSDLQKHKDGKWCAVFSTNKKEDIKKIKQMIVALETVISLYKD